MRSEVYAGWAIVAALAISFKIVHNDPGYYLLVLVLTILRMIGYWRQWHLPKKLNGRSLKMIKLIAIDLDGTLLNSDKKIPEENVKAIQKLHKQG